MRTIPSELIAGIGERAPRAIARAISLIESGAPEAEEILAGLDRGLIEQARVYGVTGPPGVGKSTLTGRLIGHYRRQGERVGVIAVDPSSPLSGGALLGDRIRMMDHALDPEVVMRSMATRGRLGGLCAAAGATVRVLAGAGCSVIIIETVGVGQSEMDVARLADLTALVLAPGQGDEIQAMKAGLLEVADLLVINKGDCPGAEGLALDLETAVRQSPGRPAGLVPILLTTASENLGVSELASTLDRLDSHQRRSGEHQARRARARRLEVVDLVLEMLRPRLEKMITPAEGATGNDPRQLANEIIAGLTGLSGLKR